MINARIRLCTVLREHRRNNIDNNIKFCLICSRYIDEDIARVQRDFTMFRVDDWGHRQDLVLGIIDDRVNRGVSDDVQIS